MTSPQEETLLNVRGFMIGHFDSYNTSPTSFYVAQLPSTYYVATNSAGVA